MPDVHMQMNSMYFVFVVCLQQTLINFCFCCSLTKQCTEFDLTSCKLLEENIQLNETIERLDKEITIEREAKKRLQVGLDDTNQQLAIITRQHKSMVEKGGRMEENVRKAVMNYEDE